MSLDERVQIEKWRDQGVGVRQIAVRLGRSPSTVSREIRRRSWTPVDSAAAYAPYRYARGSLGSWNTRQYRASVAQSHADKARACSHLPYRMRNDVLLNWVLDGLRRGWSPEMISGRLPLEFDDPHLRVSAETLYQWIYDPGQARRQLYQYLPRGRRKRRHHGGRRVHHDRIKWRVSIHERPTVVEDRAQAGHWEADSVVGLRGTGVIHTEVERTSRYVKAILLPHGTADATVKAQISWFQTLPTALARSVTCDNGTEFTQHYHLADSLGIPTYFADPYSAWQRGTNEHFNGRIRRYLPKGESFADLTQNELDQITTEINNQPRKILGWATPAEIFHELLSKPATP